MLGLSSLSQPEREEVLSRCEATVDQSKIRSDVQGMGMAQAMVATCVVFSDFDRPQL
jgi:hypothetical protein